MDNEDRQLLQKIDKKTDVLVQAFTDHIENPVIHQVPPCETVKRLESRVWASVWGSCTAAIGALLSLVLR